MKLQYQLYETAVPAILNCSTSYMVLKIGTGNLQRYINIKLGHKYLGLIFYKFLSDNEVNYILKDMKGASDEDNLLRNGMNLDSINREYGLC